MSHVGWGPVLRGIAANVCEISCGWSAVLGQADRDADAGSSETDAAGWQNVLADFTDEGLIQGDDEQSDHGEPLASDPPAPLPKPVPMAPAHDDAHGHCFVRSVLDAAAFGSRLLRQFQGRIATLCSAAGSHSQLLDSPLAIAESVWQLEENEDEVQLEESADSVEEPTHMGHEALDTFSGEDSSENDRVAVAIEQIAHVVKVWSPAELQHDDSVVSRMIDEWTSNVESRVRSVAADSDYFKTSRDTVSKYRRLAAFACLLVQNRDVRLMLEKLIDQVKDAGGECLTWTEKISADETSLPLTVCDVEGVSGLARSASASSLIERSCSQQVVTVQAKQSAVSKILQTVRQYSFLFRMQSGMFIDIFVEIVCPLQVMASKGSEVYFRCFRQSELPLGDLIKKFRRTELLTITDGDGAVARAVRAIAAARGLPTWAYKCDIHKVSNMTKDVMAVVEGHVSAIIALQLSLQSANSMTLFRRCLRQLLSERLVYKKQRPLQRDLERTRTILDCFLPAHNCTSRLKRALILSMLNGDWFTAKTVEHNCVGCCSDHNDCMGKLTSFVVSAMCSAAPATFPRSRWTGARESVNWLLLLQSCHGLLRDTYLLWSSLNRGGAWLKNVVDEEWLANASDAVRSGNLQMITDESPARFDTSSAAQPAFDPSKTSSGDPEREKWEARQAEQSQFRHTASKWLLSDPMDYMVVIRMVLGPLATLMDSYLSQSGTAWEKQQDALVASLLRSGMDPTEAMENRPYRVLMLLDGEITSAAMGEVCRLISSADQWELLPPQYRTAAIRSRVAVMLSQVGSRISSLRMQHRNYPFPLFGLLQGGDGATTLSREIEKERSCRFCAWSLAFVEAHKATGLLHESAKADLRHDALVAEFDNAPCEARHASIRRSIVASSLQTHVENVLAANAAWIMRMLRKNMYKNAPKARRGGAQHKESAGQKHEQHVRKRRGAGILDVNSRYFLSMTLLIPNHLRSKGPFGFLDT